MLARRVIPCLDVAGGRVVKGTRFVNLRDAGDPVELAVLYDREGADEVVFLDITASHEGRDIMEEVVRATAEALTIPFTVGGGLRTVDDLRRMLRAGGRSGSTGAGPPRVSMRWPGRSGRPAWVRGSSWSRAWTRTVGRTGMTWSSSGASSGGSLSLWSRPGERASCNTSWTRSRWPGPTRCWPPRSFTTGNFPSPR